MRRVRSKDTEPERVAKEALVKEDLKFEEHPGLYGHPDFLVEGKVALFVDGAFWHGRNWANLRRQLSAGTNSSYWLKHIAANRSRDREVNGELRRQGYLVLRIWDDDLLRSPESATKSLVGLVKTLRP